MRGMRQCEPRHGVNGERLGREPRLRSRKPVRTLTSRRLNKGPSVGRTPLATEGRGAYAICMSAVLRGVRRIAIPIPQNPTSIIAQVAGSGTAGVPVAKIWAFDDP